ncbi:MAG: HaeII family restriction endonuclease [Magnetococcus sp. YQC-5]
MNIIDAKTALDKVIDKGRVHLYKPIQIAEILYRDRIENDINLDDLSTYRTQSKKWRDIKCIEFLGRTSTSSSRYQDDVFNDNAIPPSVLSRLGEENRAKNGIVESYIYHKFAMRFSQMSVGLEYCLNNGKDKFKLADFLGLFWREPGLKRSIDKVYEIVVYALFSALVDVLEISIEVSMNIQKTGILDYFKEFSSKVIMLSADQPSFKTKARIHRVGVTNASDRGLDMWANFGLAIQIKHLSLTEELAERIVSSVSSDRIVIVCKDTEEKIIVSVLNQIGWKSKIQSVVTENELIQWYEKALRGQFSDLIGDNLLKILIDETQVEFPSTNSDVLKKFMDDRRYEIPEEGIWG